MNVIVDLCIIPLGVGVSLSSYVAACERVLAEAGLEPHLHANGTNIEGEWNEVVWAPPESAPSSNWGPAPTGRRPCTTK